MLKSEWHRYCMKNDKFFSFIHLMSNIYRMLLIFAMSKNHISHFLRQLAAAEQKKKRTHSTKYRLSSDNCVHADFFGRLVYLCLKSEIVRNSWQIENTLLTHKNHMQHNKDDEIPGKMLKWICSLKKQQQQQKVPLNALNVRDHTRAHIFAFVWKIAEEKKKTNQHT